MLGVKITDLIDHARTRLLGVAGDFGYLRRRKLRRLIGSYLSLPRLQQSAEQSATQRRRRRRPQRAQNLVEQTGLLGR